MIRLAERTGEEVVTEPGSGRSALRSYVPEGLVVLATLFNLWVFRSELLIVSYPNDSQTHLQMVQVATSLLSHGQLPFDHWYPKLSLGSPFFVQYQSASAVLTGLIGLVVGAKTAFAWTLYLLVAFWPVCVYWSGRLLGWDRWVSGIAAAVSPLLFSVTGRGFEHQAYAWLGSGLWSELWAMWSLPLAIGFAWRYITRKQYLFGAVFFLAATIAFHFLLAYLAALILVVMVLVKPTEILHRTGRAAIAGVGALLASLWVTLPLIAVARWTALNEFQVRTPIDDSYGAPKILHWLVTGQIYDWQQHPVVTVLVAVGLIACGVKFRSDERSRLLLSIWVLSLLLYFGRPTLGFVLDLLPGSKNLLFQRFIAGVHLAGIYLVAVGLVFVAQLALHAARRFDPKRVEAVAQHRWTPVIGGLLAGVALIGLLSPAWTHVRSYDSANTVWINYQRAVDANQGAQVDALLSLAADQGGGRVYAGMPSNWGHSFYVGGVQSYIYMENSPIDGVGFTLRGFGLMTNPEAWFNQYNLGDYKAMGIRYLLLPKGMSPPVKATFLTSSGNYVLWTVRIPGIVQVVDTTTPISANADDLGRTTKSFLWSLAPDRGIYPTVAYGGHPAAAPTLAPGERVSGPAGRVLATHDQLAEGRVASTVLANRTAVVLLSSSFDPGWSATVDGESVTPEMIAPALVGVTVAPGVHHVVFQYHGYGSYPLLFVIALLTLAAAAVGPTLWRRHGPALVAKLRSRTT